MMWKNLVYLLEVYCDQKNLIHLSERILMKKAAKSHINICVCVCTHIPSEESKKSKISMENKCRNTAASRRLPGTRRHIP